MTIAQAKALIESDPDFIFSKRFNYSLAELRKKYPDGCPDRLIAAVLLIGEDEVEKIYQRIVIKLRNSMGVNPGD